MDFSDLTYSMPLANIWSGLEPSMAVTLCCIPLLRPLISRTPATHVTKTRTSPTNTTFESLHSDDEHHLRRQESPDDAYRHHEADMYKLEDVEQPRVQVHLTSSKESRRMSSD
jgi:hypothetical protein